MDPRPGGRYGYATETGSIVVNGVREFECHGEIPEFDPPRVLAYTWMGNWHDDATRRTLVRWELTPKASGTHVKVMHSGLTDHARSPQGLFRRLAGRGRGTEEVRRAVNCMAVRNKPCGAGLYAARAPRPRKAEATRNAVRTERSCISNSTL